MEMTKSSENIQSELQEGHGLLGGGTDRGCVNITKDGGCLSRRPNVLVVRVQREQGGDEAFEERAEK